MKRIILTILVIVPLFAGAQLPVTSGLKYYWNSTIDWSDSTLYDSSASNRTDITLINFDGDSADYIQGNAYGSITFPFDSIDIPLAYVNYSLGDSLFFKWEESIDSTNGKQSRPWRLVEIAWYNTALTSIDLSNTRTYFNDTIDFTNPVIVDGGYIQDGYTSASHGDTIIVKPGYYLEDNPTYGYLLANKRAWLLGVGQVELTSNDGTYIIRNAQNDNKFEGLKCFDSGGNSAAVRTLTHTNLELKRFITEDLTTPVIIQGLQDTLKINNSIINGSSTSITVRDEDITYINNSYITGLIAHNKVSGTFYNLKVNNTRFDNQNLFGARGVADITINSSQIKSNLINIDNNDNSGVWRMTGNDITCESFNIISADSSDYDSLLFDYCDFTPAGITTEDDEIYIRFDNQPYVSVTNCRFLTPFYSQNTRIEFDATINDTNLYHVFNNNYIQNKLKSNYVISWGNQNYVGYNTIEAQVNNNLIHNFYYFYPDSSDAGSHTLFFVNNSISEFKYNRVYGGGLGIVHKSQGLDCSNSVVQGNILVNCNNSLESKGSKKVKYYNNTIYNELPQNGRGIYILKNSTESNEPADSCELYNNIVVDLTPASSGYNLITYESDQNKLYSNYNVLYSENNRISNLDSTFSAWQSRGYDDNSYNTNPNLKSITELWPVTPSNALNKGVILGEPYNIGLDTISLWTQSVVTKTQKETLWTIGAYVIDKPVVVRTNNGIIVIGVGGKKVMFKY